MTPEKNDWIGLFPADFTSIDQYVGYIWVESQPTARRPTDEDVSSPIYGATWNPIFFNRVAWQRDSSPFQDAEFPVSRRTYHQLFCDQMFVLPGDHVLIYFRNTCDVLGISHPFKVKWPSSRERIDPFHYRASSWSFLVWHRISQSVNTGKGPSIFFDNSTFYSRTFLTEKFLRVLQVLFRVQLAAKQSCGFYCNFGEFLPIGSPAFLFIELFTSSCQKAAHLAA